jgi:beta-lactamase regulating signal transducer with metallopeptidase domain
VETINRSLLTFLLNSLWQIPLVAGIAWIACRLMRNGPAAHRHAVWVAALVAAVLLPMASVLPRAATASPRLAFSYAPELAGGPSSAATAALKSHTAPAPATDPRTVAYAPAIGAVLLAAYVLFVLFRLARLAWAWRITVRIRETAEPRVGPALLEDVWTRCLEAFGLRGVELLSSPGVSSPVAAGAWCATIVLPESLFAETSADVLTTAIGHEMAHLARHDFALKLVYELLYLPVSFHPASWVIRRGIEQTREMACDELVTRELIDAGVYARSIMSIARSMSGLPQPGYTLGVFDGDILEERIRRLVERPVANLKRARLLLATGLSALAICAVIASGLALSAHAQGGAREEMKLAGDAYNRGDFETAIQHFEKAVHANPANVNAKLFLADAMIRQHNAQGEQPGGPLVTGARAQYLDVLAQEPQNKPALESMVMLSTEAKQFAEAHGWIVKLIQADPNSKTAYYTAGYLDWVTVYPEYQRARLEAGLPQNDYSIPDANLRRSLRERFLPQIEDGFRMLQTALQLDPDYDDAMAYMNLLCRLKAGIVDSSNEASDLYAQADQWVGKALATKRRNAQNRSRQPFQLDVDAPPSGALGASPALAAPPPPPPPPPPAAVAGQIASAVPMPQPHNPSERPGMFWQVLGADGLTANALIGSLKQKGFNASAVMAAHDNLVRVVAGPYSDVQSFEQAKAAIEAAGFRVLRQW